MNDYVMKKILHIIDTTGPGGAETVFLKLIEATRNSGKYQCVALIRGSGWVKSQLEEKGIEFYEINSKGSVNFQYLRMLIKLIKREKIDLIQTHLLGSGIYGCLAGLICRIPVYSTFHGMVDFSEKERLQKLNF